MTPTSMANITVVEPGAFPPPPGRIPDFDNPTDAGSRHVFMIWMIVPYVLTMGFCAVRAYVKALRCELLADDCKWPHAAIHDP